MGLRGLFIPPSVTDFWSFRWWNGGFPFRTPINVCRVNNTSPKRKANTSRNRQISVRGAWGTENVPNGSWVPVMAVPGSWQQEVSQEVAGPHHTDKVTGDSLFWEAPHPQEQSS